MQIATAAILKIEKLKYDISHDDAERVSQAYRPSAILNFQLKFLMGVALERHFLRHRVKLCGGRSYCCIDIAVFPRFPNEM